jgi:hypothetical protein
MVKDLIEFESNRGAPVWSEACLKAAIECMKSEQKMSVFLKLLPSDAIKALPKTGEHPFATTAAAFVGRVSRHLCRQSYMFWALLLREE